MKIIIAILVIIILAIIFLPIYSGEIMCGANPEKGCWHTKINLIEYIKYKQR